MPKKKRRKKKNKLKKVLRELKLHLRTRTLARRSLEQSRLKRWKMLHPRRLKRLKRASPRQNQLRPRTRSTLMIC